MSKFSRSLFSFWDLGRTPTPFCNAQRRTTWADDLLTLKTSKLAERTNVSEASIHNEMQHSQRNSIFKARVISRLHHVCSVQQSVPGLQDCCVKSQPITCKLTVVHPLAQWERATSSVASRDQRTERVGGRELRDYQKICILRNKHFQTNYFFISRDEGDQTSEKSAGDWLCLISAITSEVTCPRRVCEDLWVYEWKTLARYLRRRLRSRLERFHNFLDLPVRARDLTCTSDLTAWSEIRVRMVGGGWGY